MSVFFGPVRASRSFGGRRVCHQGTAILRRRNFSQTTSSNQSLADGDLISLKGRFDLKGKNYIVTGGGRGIGYAAVRGIAEMGGNVSVLDYAESPVKDFANLQDEFGVQTKYIKTDVTSEESLSNAFEDSLSHFGKLDGCVTAAGICPEGPFTDHKWNEVKRCFDVNITGTYFAAQNAAKHMLKQQSGGSIVLIASISARVATPGHKLSAYNASKGAVKMLNTALSVELAPAQIRVNAISPGYTSTELLHPLLEAKPERKTLFNMEPPMHRIGTRNDLVPAIIYLLSDASGYTTGTDLVISGGLHGGRIETRYMSTD